MSSETASKSSAARTPDGKLIRRAPDFFARGGTLPPRIPITGKLRRRTGPTATAARNGSAALLQENEDTPGDIAIAQSNNDSSEPHTPSPPSLGGTPAAAPFVEENNESNSEPGSEAGTPLAYTPVTTERGSSPSPFASPSAPAPLKRKYAVFSTFVLSLSHDGNFNSTHRR